MKTVPYKTQVMLSLGNIYEQETTSKTKVLFIYTYAPFKRGKFQIIDQLGFFITASIFI